jgi:hypothetical protein
VVTVEPPPDVEPRLSQSGPQVSPAASATACPISGIDPDGTQVLAAMTWKTCEGRLLPIPIGSLGMPSWSLRVGSVVAPPMSVPLLSWVSLKRRVVQEGPRVHDLANAGPSNFASQLHYPLIVKFILIVFLIVLLILLRRCMPTTASEEGGWQEPH